MHAVPFALAMIISAGVVVIEISSKEESSKIITVKQIIIMAG